MIKLLVFHHKQRRFALRIHPHYKPGGIIEVYAKHATIDQVTRRSHLCIITVKDIIYEDGIQYRKRRVLFKKLTKADRKELRRTAKVLIDEAVFYKILERGR